GKELKPDVTQSERFVCRLAERPVLTGYHEYADLPEDATSRAYSLPEIATEKIVALMDRSRTEPRDLYDTWYLVSEKHIDANELLAAIHDKLEFRKLRLSDVSI